MKKALFAIIMYCFAATTAFAQVLNINSQLNEDKPLCEIPFDDINGVNEQGRFFIKINGEPDDQGRTPVQIELRNTSYEYDFLLFDSDWSKKDLRKNHIVLDKYFGGENSKGVDKIELINRGSINTIEKYRGSYSFPEIRVKEGETYVCKIPIHLAKENPGLFCPDRKKLVDIIYNTINVTVDTRDEVYEKFKSECDSLLVAFNEAREREAFCTNSHHQPTFHEQTEEYTKAKAELKDRINNRLNDKGWLKESKKYKPYKALLDSLDEMDDALEQYNHDCGQHKRFQGNCNYCKLSLEEIYKRMNRLYLDLRNEKRQKPEVLKEAKALYNCCTNHKKQDRQWKNSEYKKSIEDYYESIKNYHD